MTSKNKFLMIFLSLLLILLFNPAHAVVSNKPKPIITVLFNEPVQDSMIVELKNKNTGVIFQLSLIEKDKSNMIFKYSPLQNLPEGNYTFKTSANDLYGNPGSSVSQEFSVSVKNIEISLLKPPFGFSSETSFDLKINTSRIAECKYSFINGMSFENMDNFQSADSITHTITNFNLSGDTNLYVKCNDSYEGKGVVQKTFNLILDVTPPIITNIYAKPNPIVQNPLSTIVFAETNEDSICRYSTSEKPFEEMEGKFLGYNNFSFNKLSQANIEFSNTEPQASYIYFVRCMNKAGNSSDIKSINISIDTTAVLLITKVNTNEQQVGKDVTLDLETNKGADCYNGNISIPFQTRFTTTSGLFHKHTMTNLAFGKYSYFITCASSLNQRANTTISFTLSPCAMKGDLQDNGICSNCVDNVELAKYIDRWLKDEVSPSDLAKVIDNWLKHGCT